MPKKNLPAKTPRPDKNEQPVDFNQLMDMLLDTGDGPMNPADLPVEFIFHVAVCNPEGDLEILVGHDICAYRYGDPRFKGYRTVHHSIDMHKLYNSTAKEANRIWEKVMGRRIDPLDDDTYWDL